MPTAQLLDPGDSVRLLHGHPWAGHEGRLIQYEKYGPGGMFEGWRVKLRTDDAMNGHECYASPGKLKKIK